MTDPINPNPAVPATEAQNVAPVVAPSIIAPATAPVAPAVVPAAPAAPVKTTISIDDFAKVEIKVGKILSAEKLPGSDKLLKLSVDFAEAAPRQVLSGIAKQFPEPQALVGRTCPFVTNLEPRKMMGLESQAMILALSTPEGAFSLLGVGENIPVGTKVK